MAENIFWKISFFPWFCTYLNSKWPLVTFNELGICLVIKRTKIDQNNRFSKNFEKNHTKKSFVLGQGALLIRPELFFLTVPDFLLFIRLQAPQMLYSKPIKFLVKLWCHMFIRKILLQKRKTAPPTDQKKISEFFF